ncbi:MAG: DUF349 domain-containing protein [Bacteroidales bacterium]
MENKEQSTPGAVETTRQTEERLNPEGETVNNKDTEPQPEAAESSEKEAPEKGKPEPKKKASSNTLKAGETKDKPARQEKSPTTAEPDAEGSPEAEDAGEAATPSSKPAAPTETEEPLPAEEAVVSPEPEDAGEAAASPSKPAESTAPTETEEPLPAEEAVVSTETEEPLPASETEAIPTAQAEEVSQEGDVPQEGKPSPPPVDEVPAPEATSGTEKDTKTAAKSDAGREDAEDQEEDLAERYSRLNREELVEVAESLIQEEDVNRIRTHIGYLKAAFRKILKEESIVEYEKRLQNEGDQEEAPAEAPSDPLTERFDKAFATYREKKALFDQALEQQKLENLSAKENILEALRNLIDSEEELKKTYDLFRDLQDQWRSVGAVPQSAKGTLWNNYHFLVEKFFDKVKINKELKDLDLRKNLEAKTDLCEKAEELLLETSVTKSFQRLQKLHEAWKETGPVPKDKKDEIWDRFKAATDKLNKRRQEYYDGLRDEQNNNYSAKLILCEKAELAAAATPASPRQWQQQTNEINELFKMWKSIGFAPKKVNNEVWNRFRMALDTFYKNKKEFFKKYKEIQTENYNQKLNLCMQAEALKDNDDWKSTTEELITLQKEWKKIGPVPAKFSDKIWKRFRAACDEFFSRKSDHFSNIGEKQEENLRKKLELIEKVKTHAYSNDNAENLELLKEFQRQWINIGHVPIKQKDKIQNEFRKVIDNQFEVLNISQKVKNTLSFRSKIEGIKGKPQGDNIIYKERSLISNRINAIQSDIKIWENNIGFFASSKKADILKAEFEDKIDKGKQEISLLEEKLKILRE